MLTLKSFVTATAIILTGSISAIAGDAPSIGGNASLNVNIGQAGVVNAGAGASGFQGSVKQSVGSVLSGNISGGLKDNVSIGQAGVVNVGAGASGAKVTACQSIGSIGSNCDS
ncbi:hypothetical protein NUH88_07140 [Nisaea acidiphila]|uniref:Uncharacterized protein n=1 Tax=Nisaea acidiphila TaxID=1862145 RepID=A0A9J7AVU4_9PROT|nr:hypothetical protein [Nisaea acidiphila]UUX51463.1 hypothetical protein NUH88_07140 [Nisaea acidiphila]